MQRKEVIVVAIETIANLVDSVLSNGGVTELTVEGKDQYALGVVEFNMRKMSPEILASGFSRTNAEQHPQLMFQVRPGKNALRMRQSLIDTLKNTEVTIKTSKPNVPA